MIDPDKLEAGVPYFMLGFHDRDAKIPQVYTYIFVGRCPDKLDPKLPEKLCFRTGDSLPEMLSYQQIVEEVKKDGHEKSDFICSERNLQLMYDLDGLIDELGNRRG